MDGGRGRTSVIIIVTTMMATFTMTLCDYLIRLLTAPLASQHSPSSRGQSHLCDMFVVFRVRKSFGEYVSCLFRVTTALNRD
jgi:hypothetical protein